MGRGVSYSPQVSEIWKAKHTLGASVSKKKKKKCPRESRELCGRRLPSGFVQSTRIPLQGQVQKCGFSQSLLKSRPTAKGSPGSGGLHQADQKFGNGGQDQSLQCPIRILCIILWVSRWTDKGQGDMLSKTKLRSCSDVSSLPASLCIAPSPLI